LSFFNTIDSKGQTKYQKDFEQFISIIRDNYAYLKQQNIDINRIGETYRPQAEKVSSRDEFVRLLENILIELHNGHTSLNTNLASSNRLVPTGMDMYVEKIKGQYTISDIRKNSAAEKCGLKTGMEIVEFNGAPVEDQLKKFFPKYTNTYDNSMLQFALDMLFAGTHDKPRVITIMNHSEKRDFYPDNCKADETSLPLTPKKLNSYTGYIKINNSLGNNDLINAFDNAVDSFFNTKILVIDLSETPSGGNTTVARSIMGRFLATKTAYQQHEMDELPFDTKRYWIEYVLPRRKMYKGKVYVIVGHWTGSMGEGMAMGFDVMKNSTVIGTRMAGLLGAIDGFELNETRIHFQIPTERLYHINATPREKFLPKILTRDTDETFERLNKLIQVWPTMKN